MTRNPVIPALTWIAATTIGLVAGGFAFHFPGSIGGQADWSLPAGIVDMILGLMTGAAVGVLADVLSDAIGLPFEETGLGWATDHAFDGLIVGLLWGGATAWTGIADRLRAGGRLAVLPSEVLP